MVNLQFEGTYANSVDAGFKSLLFFSILHLSANLLGAEERGLLTFRPPLLSVSLLSFWSLVVMALDSVETAPLSRVVLLHAALTLFVKFVEPAADLESPSGYICMIILAIKVKSLPSQVSLR